MVLHLQKLWTNSYPQELIDILAPKNGVVQDLIAAIQKKANLSDEVASQLRIYETHGCKIVKELSANAVIANISDYSTLYAEVVPQEEREAGDDDLAIYAFHFDKEPNKVHGVPFKFVIKPVSKVQARGFGVFCLIFN